MADPNSIFSLNGKVACVTGASSGLGRHAANLLSSAGAKVVGVARRQDHLSDWQADDPDRRAYVCGDLSNAANLSEMAENISSHFGSPDILVSAAGLNLRQHADDVTPEGWNQTIAVNLGTPMFLAQAMAPAMKERRWGRIVNFASLQTTRAFPSGIAYGTAKSGVAQMTRAMAEAWSGFGINANAIGPGFFETELTAPVFADPELAARNAAQTCIGRNGLAEDLDGPLLFLCSDASRYVTGQVLMVDGGFTAK